MSGLLHKFQNLAGIDFFHGLELLLLSDSGYFLWIQDFLLDFIMAKSMLMSWLVILFMNLIDFIDFWKWYWSCYSTQKSYLASAVSPLGKARHFRSSCNYEYIHQNMPFCGLHANLHRLDSTFSSIDNMQTRFLNYVLNKGISPLLHHHFPACQGADLVTINYWYPRFQIVVPLAVLWSRCRRWMLWVQFCKPYGVHWAWSPRP